MLALLCDTHTHAHTHTNTHIPGDALQLVNVLAIGSAQDRFCDNRTQEPGSEFRLHEGTHSFEYCMKVRTVLYAQLMNTHEGTYSLVRTVNENA